METRNKQKAIQRNNHISLLNIHWKGDVCLLLDHVKEHICHQNANSGILLDITQFGLLLQLHLSYHVTTY